MHDRVGPPRWQRAGVIVLALALLFADLGPPPASATATSDWQPPATEVGDALDVIVGPEVVTGFTLPADGQLTTGQTFWSSLHVTNNGSSVDGRFDMELEVRRDGGISTDDLTLEEPWDGEELDFTLDDDVLRAHIDAQLRLGSLSTLGRAFDLTVLRSGSYAFTTRVVGTDGDVTATATQPLEVTDSSGPINRSTSLTTERVEDDSIEVAGLEVDPSPGTTARTLRSRTVALVAGDVEVTAVPVAHGDDASTLLAFTPPVATAVAKDAVAALHAQGVVRDARPVPMFTTMQLPNDPLFDQQWALHGPATGSDHGIDVTAAWERTQGSEDVVVAVVDTGGLAHPDLADRMVPGANVVDDQVTDRDILDDGTDPGTWVESDDGDLLQRSVWHGTHVAGIIGATTDNDRGIAGVDQRSRIQHIRALGVGGHGHPLEIAAAIRWAAGLPVTGMDPNPTPARVINLSLGAPGRCPSVFQSAITDAVAAGALVVAAAGNESRDLRLAPATPLSCDHVIGVTATDERGARAPYANAGPSVDLAAPGGGGHSIASTYNPGEREAETDAFGRPVDHYVGLVGTSMAAPHAAGVASLVVAANPDLRPKQTAAVLRAPTSVRAFATADIEPHHRCSDDPLATDADFCGAGMLDAGRAVTTAVEAATTVTLSGPTVLDTGTAGGPLTATVDNLSTTDLPARDLDVTILSGNGQIDIDIEVATDTGWLPVESTTDGDGVVTATVPVAPLEAGSRTEVELRLTGHRAARLRLGATLGGQREEVAEPSPVLVAAERSTLTVDRDAFAEDDDTGTVAEVVLRDVDGDPVAEREVTLAATPEDAVSIEPTTATTDEQGHAAFIVTPSAAGEAELTATDGTATLEPVVVSITHAPLERASTSTLVQPGQVVCDSQVLAPDAIHLDDDDAFGATCHGVRTSLEDLTSVDALRSGRVVVLRPGGTPSLRLDPLPAGIEVAVWLRSSDTELTRFETVTSGATSLPLTVPQATGPGEHVLHLAWRAADGERRSVDIGLLVAPPPFADVDPASVHAPAIARVAALGITTGRSDGSFGPREDVIRGQFASFLTRTLQLDPVEDPPELSDLEGSVHADAVRTVVGHGYASGYLDGRFGIGDPVRRDQMATMLAGAAELEPQATGPFVDLDGNVHAERVNALVAAGLTQGVTPDRYDPTGTVRREQLATFLVRLLDHLDTVA